VVGASQVKLLGNWEELVKARKKETRLHKHMCKSLGRKLYSLSLSLSLSYFLALVSVSLSISLSQDLLESGLLPEFC
jgi:hypothetical protein